MPPLDRHWLLTWTCYGTWLAGDARGFVSNVGGPDGPERHNRFGTPYSTGQPKLEAWMRSRMTGPPVSLARPDALALIEQYRETAAVKGWRVEGASVMFNHTHVVLGVAGDPDPQAVLELVKSWATRRLKRHRPLPPNGTFWTARGSKRKVSNVRAAVVYVVRKQPNPLAVYWDERWQAVVDAFDAASRLASRDPSGSGCEDEGNGTTGS